VPPEIRNDPSNDRFDYYKADVYSVGFLSFLFLTDEFASITTNSDDEAHDVGRLDELDARQKEDAMLRAFPRVPHYEGLNGQAAAMWALVLKREEIDPELPVLVSRMMAANPLLRVSATEAQAQIGKVVAPPHHDTLHTSCFLAFFLWSL